MSTFHVFRVSEGIGNACAFEFPDGSLGIIDWGTQEDEPIKELDLHEGLRIRFILATHAHADHVLGIPKLMKACIASGTSIGRLVFPSGYMKGLGKDYLREARTIAKDRRCCTTLTVEDSQRESMRLDGLHEQAIPRPLPHDKLVQLHCLALQARFAVDLAGQGHDLALAA